MTSSLKFAPLPKVTQVRIPLTLPSDVADEFSNYIRALQEFFPASTVNQSEIIQQMIVEAMSSDRAFQNWKRRKQSGPAATTNNLGENFHAEPQQG